MKRKKPRRASRAQSEFYGKLVAFLEREVRKQLIESLDAEALGDVEAHLDTLIANGYIVIRGNVAFLKRLDSDAYMPHLYVPVEDVADQTWIRASEDGGAMMSSMLSPNSQPFDGPTN